MMPEWPDLQGTDLIRHAWRLVYDTVREDPWFFLVACLVAAIGAFWP